MSLSAYLNELDIWMEINEPKLFVGMVVLIGVLWIGDRVKKRFK